MPRRLAAVPEGAEAPKKVSKTVTKAAADGDRRDLLVAMRARVATAVEDPNTPARDLAALTRRLMEIAKDIEAMDAREKEDGPGAVVPDESFDTSAI
jgi:hypothetical protein